MTAPTSGHVLRVSTEPVAAGVSCADLRVECQAPHDTECRTGSGGCLVEEQAAGDIPWEDYYDGNQHEDDMVTGQPIQVTYTADGVYEWRYAERASC